MAKVFLICGKICSGKTTYAEKLKGKEKAVVLSSDELMLSIFDPLLGERHDEISRRANAYLMKMAVKLTEAGMNVILDWGFWTKRGRGEVSSFFEKQGIETEWHYLAVSDEQWKRNIEKRNEEVLAGRTQAYYVDEGLLRKLESRFEEPGPEETVFRICADQMKEVQKYAET